MENFLRNLSHLPHLASPGLTWPHLAIQLCIPSVGLGLHDSWAPSGHLQTAAAQVFHLLTATKLRVSGGTSEGREGPTKLLLGKLTVYRTYKRSFTGRNHQRTCQRSQTLAECHHGICPNIGDGHPLYGHCQSVSWGK